MNYTLFDLLGNLGVVMILLAYIGLQLKRLPADAPAYSLLNAIGALLILISLYFDFNLSAIIIESCWLLISLYGLFKARRSN